MNKTCFPLIQAYSMLGSNTLHDSSTDAHVSYSDKSHWNDIKSTLLTKF